MRTLRLSGAAVSTDGSALETEPSFPTPVSRVAGASTTMEKQETISPGSPPKLTTVPCNSTRPNGQENEHGKSSNLFVYMGGQHN